MDNGAQEETPGEKKMVFSALAFLFFLSFILFFSFFIKKRSAIPWSCCFCLLTIPDRSRVPIIGLRWLGRVGEPVPWCAVYVYEARGLLEPAAPANAGMCP